MLIAAQPTRGLDVGAIEFVHRRLVEERDEGRAVLLVSLELEEVLSLADRILVIYEGRIVGEFDPSVTEEELGIAMTGGTRARRAPHERAARASRRSPSRAAYAPSVAERLAFYQRAGGVITPLFTAVLAFFVGGLVVLATGHNPLATYKAIWDGTGLNWFFQFGHHHIDDPVHAPPASSSGGTPTRTRSRRTTCRRR